MMQARSFTRSCRSQAGFTLAEVMIAMLLLAIGLIGAVGAASTQVRGALASAATTGLGAIQRSGGMSTATMLAQQKIEQLKANYSAVPVASTGCAGSVSGSVCSEANVDGYPQFSRTSTFVTAGLPANSVAVRVEVTYKAAGTDGLTLGGTVALATVIARHP
jgi:prepilin-type N-terminal cleavage/methylation domain-containing protein